MTTLRTPPLLLGAALLFWGWQSGLLLVGALMAVVLESARVVGVRWELSEKEFKRIWDFTVFLFVGVAIYLFTSNEGPKALAGLFGDGSPASQNKVVQQTAKALLLLFRWAPMIFFLFVAAQAYTTREKIPVTVFSILARRHRALAPLSPANLGVNTAYPYFAVCLLAASITVRLDHAFYAGLALLLAWALWPHRSKRYAAAGWAALLALALAGGFFAQRGFFELTSWANLYSATWLAQFMGGGTDPRESHTALGRIGRLKLSGKIVLRVEPQDHRPVPPLLREASYRFFKFPDWSGAPRDKPLVELHPEAAPTETNQYSWELAPRPQIRGAVTIAQFLTGHGEAGRLGLLALPHGIVRIENLPSYTVLSTNGLGVVRAEGPGLALYTARFAARSTIDEPPDPHDDRTIPPSERAVLARIVGELGLRGQSTNQMLKTLSAFFLDHFQYSTWLPSSHRGQTNLTPLASFLLHDRAGHCEYFATAAALLLRAAGVPTRYAVGYAVHEKSGRKFVVRQRDAHAWCLVWVDGSWRDFDVTPGSWMEAEAGRASWFEWLSDVGSRLWFEFSKWRWGQTNWQRYLLWALGPLLAVLLVRMFFGKQWKRLRQEQRRRAAALLLPGFDSEFYLIEKELGQRGVPRQSSETPLDWLERVRDHPPLAALRAPLHRILRLHYRYRFDPAGLGPADRQELKSEVRSCLERLRERVTKAQ